MALIVHPVGPCHALPAPPGAVPCIVERRGRRALEFTPGHVQSEMLLADPDRLMLAYTRAMMCFALFVPHPRHIVMVGLGGGSLAKFCHRHFPTSRITVLELRADVIALRAQFAIPPDDARFQVVRADATAWLAGRRNEADVILVDGFDAAGLPPALGSARFYGHCRRALREDGVLVANMFSYDPHYGPMRARLERLFRQRVCLLAGVAGNNRILFALNSAPTGPRATPALRWQRWLAQRDGSGAGLLNRILIGAVLLWLTRTPFHTKRQHKSA